MLETLALMGHGFVNAMSLSNLLFMAGGTAIGIIIGCLPGLSAVPSVPRYSKYTWYTYFSVRFTIIFQCCWRMPCFWALKINGNENRKDFDRRTKPFHEIVLL